MFRRETIIALRARHTAYRIASDILYPQVDVEPPPEPAIPWMPPETGPRLRRRSARATRIAAALIWALTLAILIFVYYRPKG